MRKSIRGFSLCTWIAGCVAIGAAHAQPTLDLLKGTPVGSWQTRLHTSTSEAGETTAMTMTNSLLGEEPRDGEKYVWVETEIQTTKTDKNGKSKTNPTVVAKALVKRSALEGNGLNAMRNPLGSASEIIMQVGDKDPIRYTGKTIGQANGAMGMQVNYTWQEAGSESVTVPGGTFDCKRLHGKGNVETKVLIKTFKVESEGDWWFSTAVPFGMVKAEGKQVVNGKPETFTMQLKSFGSSGAKSKITKTPTDVPDLGGILSGKH
jgi:hypothetical protein